MKPRAELGLRASLGRLADRTDDEPAEKKPPRDTEFARTPMGWVWRCRCGARSWRPDLDKTAARADHAAHLREAPVHRQTGWFNPKVTR